MPESYKCTNDKQWISGLLRIGRAFEHGFAEWLVVGIGLVDTGIKDLEKWRNSAFN